MCLFSEDSNYQPMWNMIILSNMPKAVAGQAPPKRRPCMPYCSGFKGMTLKFACVQALGLLYRTTFPFLTLYQSWYGHSSKQDIIVRFS